MNRYIKHNIGLNQSNLLGDPLEKFKKRFYE